MAKMWAAVPMVGPHIRAVLSRPVPRMLGRFVHAGSNGSDGAPPQADKASATGATSSTEPIPERNKETRRGLTAKLLEGLLSNKDEKPAETEDKSALDFLEGPRLDIFPGKSDILGNASPTEGQQIESWRQKLESLSSKKEAEALAEMNGARVPMMQDFFGDKYGDLSDHFNRKLYDNDVNAAPDIREACTQKGGLPLEEQIIYFNKMIMESEATNKLELCQALPLLMCSNKWSMVIREDMIRCRMEGVVDEERQARMARRKAKNEAWFAHIRAKKAAAAIEAERLDKANFYELQRERDNELDMDDEDTDVDWREEAEVKRKATIAKKASAKTAHFNQMRKRKAEIKAKTQKKGR